MVLAAAAAAVYTYLIVREFVIFGYKIRQYSRILFLKKIKICRK